MGHQWSNLYLAFFMCVVGISRGIVAQMWILYFCRQISQGMVCVMQQVIATDSALRGSHFATASKHLVETFLPLVWAGWGGSSKSAHSYPRSAALFTFSTRWQSTYLLIYTHVSKNGKFIHLVAKKKSGFDVFFRIEVSARKQSKWATKEMECCTVGIWFHHPSHTLIFLKKIFVMNILTKLGFRNGSFYWQLIRYLYWQVC